ncbi:hypothetical protein RDWZM_002401 [Blomia tropicalis]|uniref:WD40 repeat-like protein n=1 Tax=Blomia tropicalis TaxID=40697 RepID=A0A9Q0RS66_BLOTA|nr:hypothetical protein RDWZM_002401 [Blomia tropicalis]
MDLNPSVRPLVGGTYRTATRIEPYARISHMGNVLRARVMPNNPWIIASRSCNSKIYLFDSRPYTSKSLKQTKSDGLEFQPLATLKGHHQPGRALTWQPNMIEGQTSLIASGGIDSKINIYQIGSEPVRSNPLSTLYGHQMEVMDVQFNNINKDMLVSVSRDKTIRVWDVRTKQATQIYATPHEINCVAFHPHSEFTFLTGSSDSSVLLWDSRNTNYPLFEPLRAHSLPVRMCSWFPNSETIFATGGDDGRIIFWDLHRENVDPARIRMENSEFNDPAYPRLPIQVFFIHGGHMNPITDFAWNANEDWLCTSMDNHHMMMTWRIGEHCVPKYQYKISELDLMASNEATNSN